MIQNLHCHLHIMSNYSDKHEHPPSKSVRGVSVTSNITVLDLDLSLSKVISAIRNYTPYTITMPNMNTLGQNMKDKFVL